MAAQQLAIAAPFERLLDARRRDTLFQDLVRYAVKLTGLVQVRIVKHVVRRSPVPVSLSLDLELGSARGWRPIGQLFHEELLLFHTHALVKQLLVR